DLKQKPANYTVYINGDGNSIEGKERESGRYWRKEAENKDIYKCGSNTDQHDLKGNIDICAWDKP
ncbi:MAG: hypothetical protein K0R94_294, partial [Burkholderiales bacterium]|nr:hypothetical protein [Burkholderiales bacterium]